MSELRVLLADDHAMVREGLKALIQAEPDLELIGEAGDGEAAYEQALRLRPDVVVMDVSMPGVSGLEATERLKQACPEIRVVALTAQEHSGYVRRLLEAGASGYLLKRAAATVLIEAIRTVAAGGVYLDPSIAGHVVEGYVRPRPGGATSELSAREEEVLRLLAQGYSNKEIAARLQISVKTVETHKARAMEKLDLGSRVDLVRYALQHGWLANA
jgi:DNA-binding NarL/FixJ family response regulator